MIRKKSENISYKIMKIAGTGVLFTVVSVLTPVFPYLILRSYLRKVFREDYNPTQLRDSVKYLKHRKFIGYKNRKFVLTKLGQKYLNRRTILNELYIKSVLWDGKWRVVSFDIPQDRLAARHAFRRKLKELGFYHFQRSVFINPYPCEKQIDALATELGVAQDVYLLVADRFNNDSVLVKKFGLKDRV